MDIVDIREGMSEEYAKVISDKDIELFAKVSGDCNPLHLDEDFAKGSRFRGRIAHGFLSASFISTVFGTRFPGPGCIYLSQNLRFIAPVYIGDSVVAKVTVCSVDLVKRVVTFSTCCFVDGHAVIDGEAKIYIPS